jgi:hypothetical protein
MERNYIIIIAIRSIDLIAFLGKEGTNLNLIYSVTVSKVFLFEIW